MNNFTEKRHITLDNAANDLLYHQLITDQLNEINKQLNSYFLIKKVKGIHGFALIQLIHKHNQFITIMLKSYTEPHKLYDFVLTFKDTIINPGNLSYEL